MKIEVNGTYNIKAERELYAEFTITNITLHPDPDHRLRETYYLVYINDTFGYEMPFVISESNLSNYEEAVGETVLFRLHMSVGHEIMVPHDWLITNILATKNDDYLGWRYYVCIDLVEEVSSLPFWVPWLIGTIAAVTSVLTVLVLKRTIESKKP